MLKFSPNLVVRAPRIPSAVDHCQSSFFLRNTCSVGRTRFVIKRFMHNEILCAVVCIYVCLWECVCVIMCVLCTVVHVHLIVKRESGMVLWRNRRGSFIDSLVVTWACLKAVCRLMQHVCSHGSNLLSNTSNISSFS